MNNTAPNHGNFRNGWTKEKISSMPDLKDIGKQCLTGFAFYD